MSNFLQQIDNLHHHVKLQTIKFCDSNNSEQLLTIEQNATIAELATKIIAADTGWRSMIANSNVEMEIELRVRYHGKIDCELKSSDLVKNKIGSQDIVIVHLKSPNQSSKVSNSPMKHEKQHEHVPEQAQTQGEAQLHQANCRMGRQNMGMGNSYGVRDNQRSVYMQRVNGVYPFAPVDASMDISMDEKEFELKLQSLEQEQAQLQLQQDVYIYGKQPSKHKNGIIIAQLEWDISKVLEIYNNGIYEQDFPMYFLNVNKYDIKKFQYCFLSFRVLFEFLHCLFHIDKKTRACIDGQWILYPKNATVTLNSKQTSNVDLNDNCNLIAQDKKNMPLLQLERDVMKVINHFNAYDGRVFESDFAIHFFQINGYYIERVFEFGLSFRQTMKLLKQFYDEFNIDTDSRAYIDGQWIFYSKNGKKTIEKPTTNAQTQPKFTKPKRQELQDQTPLRCQHENIDSTILTDQLEHGIIQVLKVYNNGIIEQDFPFCFLNVNKYGINYFQCLFFSSFRQLFECYENSLFCIDKYSRQYIDSQWILYPRMAINNINRHIQVATYACGSNVNYGANNNIGYNQKRSVTSVGHGVEKYYPSNGTKDSGSCDDAVLRKLGSDIVKVLKQHKNGVIEKDFGLYFFNINGYYLKDIPSLFISFRPLIESLKALYDEFDIDKNSRVDIDGQWILHEKCINDDIATIDHDDEYQVEDATYDIGDNNENAYQRKFTFPELQLNADLEKHDLQNFNTNNNNNGNASSINSDDNMIQNMNIDSTNTDVIDHERQDNINDNSAQHQAGQRNKKKKKKKKKKQKKKKKIESNINVVDNHNDVNDNNENPQRPEFTFGEPQLDVDLEKEEKESPVHDLQHFYSKINDKVNKNINTDDNMVQNANINAIDTIVHIVDHGDLAQQQVIQRKKKKKTKIEPNISVVNNPNDHHQNGDNHNANSNKCVTLLERQEREKGIGNQQKHKQKQNSDNIEDGTEEEEKQPNVQAANAQYSDHPQQTNNTNDHKNKEKEEAKTKKKKKKTMKQTKPKNFEYRISNIDGWKHIHDIYFYHNVNIIKEIQYIHTQLFSNNNSYDNNNKKDNNYKISNHHRRPLHEKYTKNEYKVCKSLLNANVLWSCNNDQRASIKKMRRGWRFSASHNIVIKSNFALRGVLGKYYFEIKLTDMLKDCHMLKLGFYYWEKNGKRKSHVCYDFVKTRKFRKTGNKYKHVQRHISAGDTIGVVVDYNKREIEFLRNGQKFGAVFFNISCRRKYLGPYFRIGFSTITVIFDQQFFKYPMPEGCESYFINTTVMIVYIC